MSGRWFRLYDELVDDPKVQRLNGETFKGLINLWCLASKNDGILPPVNDVAFSLHTTPAKATRLISDLRLVGLLDDDDDGSGQVRPHNWGGRQFKSDVSNERVKRLRQRRRNGDGNVTSNVTATPPETETETETEQNQNSEPERDSSFPSVAPSKPSGAAQLELVSEEQLEIPASLDRRAYPEDFETLWGEYRPIASPNATKADAHRAWSRLSKADKANCWTGVVRYAVWLPEENSRRAAAKRTPLEAKHLASFINKRGWEPFLEQVA